MCKDDTNHAGTVLALVALLVAANLEDDATSEALDALASLARVKGGVTYGQFLLKLPIV